MVVGQNPGNWMVPQNGGFMDLKFFPEFPSLYMWHSTLPSFCWISRPMTLIDFAGTKWSETKHMEKSGMYTAGQKNMGNCHYKYWGSGSSWQTIPHPNLKPLNSGSDGIPIWKSKKGDHLYVPTFQPNCISLRIHCNIFGCISKWGILPKLSSKGKYCDWSILAYWSYYLQNSSKLSLNLA